MLSDDVRARRGLLAGEDPGLAIADARQAALAAADNTFKQIAGEYQAKLAREGRAAKTLGKIEWYLTFALLSLGELDVRSIAAAIIESRGRYETARKTARRSARSFDMPATTRAENDQHPHFGER